MSGSFIFNSKLANSNTSSVFSIFRYGFPSKISESSFLCDYSYLGKDYSNKNNAFDLGLNGDFRSNDEKEPQENPINKVELDQNSQKKQVSTDDKTIQNEIVPAPIAEEIQNTQENKKKYFESKRLGRMNNQRKNNNYPAQHNKFSKDNIIRKIKTGFIQHSLDYINRQYELHLNSHKIRKAKQLLQRINPKEYLKIKKEDNMKWFQLKLKDVFSSHLSAKCSTFQPDHNIIQIGLLYKENEAKNVISILDKKVTDLYKEYCDDIEAEGFKTLKDEMEILKGKMMENKEVNVDGYLNNYKEIAKNLEDKFRLIKGRNNSNK